MSFATRAPPSWNSERAPPCSIIVMPNPRDATSSATDSRTRIVPLLALPRLKGPRDMAIIGSERLNRIACAFPAPSASGRNRSSRRPAFTHPLQSSFPLEAPLNGANGTQAGSLCYINAVASSLQVHGDSSRDGSGRSLDSPEGQCSIGFQPVFRSHVERCSTLLARLNCVPSSCGFGCHRYHTGMLKSTLGGNYEYFHLQALSNSDFFEPSSACDFI
jgi:hypothetical protein